MDLVFVLRIFLIEGFHLLGDKNRTMDQNSVLRISLIEGIHLLGDSDQTKNQVSVLSIFFGIRFPPAR